MRRASALLPIPEPVDEDGEPERVAVCENEEAAVSSLFLEAAGQGFEPQLPGPEPGVLPLDDPATAEAVYRVGYGVLGSPISSRYTGTRRFSASVSIRATTST